MKILNNLIDAISIVKGDTTEFEFTIINSKTHEPEPMGDTVGELIIRETPTRPTLVMPIKGYYEGYDPDPAVIIADQLVGKIRFRFESADTISLKSKKFHYEVKIKVVTPNYVQTLKKGDLYIQ